MGALPPSPQPSPAPTIHDVHEICVHDTGGFALHWDLLARDESVLASSGSYPAPQTRCLGCTDVSPELSAGSEMRCRVKAVYGIEGDCGEGDRHQPSMSLARYDPSSLNRANYKCNRSTTTMLCMLQG